jgi:hypothetical protein
MGCSSFPLKTKQANCDGMHAKWVGRSGCVVLLGTIILFRAVAQCELERHSSPRPSPPKQKSNQHRSWRSGPVGKSSRHSLLPWLWALGLGRHSKSSYPTMLKTGCMRDATHHRGCRLLQPLAVPAREYVMPIQHAII